MREGNNFYFGKIKCGKGDDYRLTILKIKSGGDCGGAAL